MLNVDCPCRCDAFTFFMEYRQRAACTAEQDTKKGQPSRIVPLSLILKRVYYIARTLAPLSRRLASALIFNCRTLSAEQQSFSAIASSS